jgi:hypothetical protein
VNKLAIVVAMLVAAAGCSDKAKQKPPSKMPGLCVEGSRLLVDGKDLDTETYQGVLNNTLDACSQACDEEDDSSCQKLDKHLATLCGVSVRVCDSLCSDGKADPKTDSLTRYACQHDSKPN